MAFEAKFFSLNIISTDYIILTSSILRYLRGYIVLVKVTFRKIQAVITKAMASQRPMTWVALRLVSISDKWRSYLLRVVVVRVVCFGYEFRIVSFTAFLNSEYNFKKYPTVVKEVLSAFVKKH